jgi:hypothetical protein
MPLRKRYSKSSSQKTYADLEALNKTKLTNKSYFVVEYITEMLEELIVFAKYSNLEFLSYLLELARCEADKYYNLNYSHWSAISSTGSVFKH